MRGCTDIYSSVFAVVLVEYFSFHRRDATRFFAKSCFNCRHLLAASPAAKTVRQVCSASSVKSSRRCQWGLPGRAKQEISSHKCLITHVKAAQLPRDDTTTANTLNTSLRRALICSAEQGTRIREVRPIQRVRAPASCEESIIPYWWVSTLESRHVTARGACAFTRSLTRTHHFEMHRSVQL